MSTPPITCEPDDSLNDAARLMWDHDCGAVLVTLPSGQLVGMVTDRDICMAGYTQGKAVQRIPVADVMAREVYTCRSVDPVRRALLSMKRHQVRRLPVVDADNTAIGVISLNNLTRYCACGDGQLQRDLLQTMAAICQPRSVATWYRGVPGYPFDELRN